MDNVKEKSKRAFNQQAFTYDDDIKSQHGRTTVSNTADIPFKRTNRYRYI